MSLIQSEERSFYQTFYFHVILHLWKEEMRLVKLRFIPLRSSVINYQNESIMPHFAILLGKILKSHPCPKWSRVYPHPNETKPKCTSGFIIHVVKGFGWWFVDLGLKSWFINYSLMDCKVEKKLKIILDDLENLYVKFVLDWSAPNS